MSGTVLVTQPAASLPTATPDSSTKLLAQTAQGTRQVDAADALAGKTIADVKAAAPTDPAHVARKQDVADAVADKATTQALSQGLAGKADAASTAQAIAAKADAAATAQALAAKADTTALDQVKTVAEAALPATGGTATGLKSATTPTDDQHVVRKTDLDATTIVLPSRSVVMTRSIPSSVTGIQTLGYAAPGDKGMALYARVTSEPVHPGKIQSADGAWWELADTEVNPYQLGGKGRDNSADEAVDTAAVLNAMAVVEARASAFGAQMASPGQPVLRIPSGAHFRCAIGTRIVSYASGVSILGTGRTSKLGRCEIHMGGFRAEVRNLSLTDYGTWGVRFFGRSRRKGRCVAVQVRDRLSPFHWEGPGGSDRMFDCEAEKCGAGLTVFGTGGMQVVGCAFAEDVAAINGKASRQVGIQLWNAGELKLTNVSANGTNRSMHLIGSTRCNAVEMYFTQVTATLSARTRALPILAVTDDGNGFARFQTATSYTYSQVLDRGGRFIARTLPTAVHTVTATAGTYTVLAMGMDNLLTGSVSVQGTPAATAAALAANINQVATNTQWYAASVGADLIVRCGEPLRPIDDLTLDWSGTGGVAAGSSPIVLEATAEARLAVSSSKVTAGNVTSILAGSTELVDAFAWPATDVQVTAAINARSAVTGYTATRYNGKVYVYGPRANPGPWTQITVSGTGDAVNGLVPRSFKAIPLSAATDYTVGEDVSLSGASNTQLIGFAEIIHMEDASTPCFELGLAGAYSGSVCRPNLLTPGERDVQVSTGITAYDSVKHIPSAVGDDYFVSQVAFSGASTGTALAYRFDVLYEAAEQNNAINDIYEVECNYNRRRIRSAYNINSYNCRFKNNNQIDPRANVAYRSHRIAFDGSPRGRGEGVGDDILPSGAYTGYSVTGYTDASGSVNPGSGSWGARAPRIGDGRYSNQPVAYNGVAVGEVQASLYSGSTAVTVQAGYAEAAGHRATQLPGSVNYWELVSNVTGQRVFLNARGDDAAIGSVIQSKGTADIELNPGGLRSLRVRGVASAVNYAELYQSVAGSPVVLGAAGADTNVSLRLNAKGAGSIAFGNPAQLASYTKATAPDPSVCPRALISVSDASSGAAPCYSLSTSWLNLRTNATLA